MTENATSGKWDARRSWLRQSVNGLTPLLALGVALGWVLALYGRALGFSFLFDDTLDLTRVEGRSYLSLLTSSEGYSYFRPIPFVLWKLSHQILGYYDETLLHALPLLAHSIAGWLLFLLIRRLGAGYWAVFPALLFLTYPFSYQDVAIVGVVFHPLAGMAMLASLNLYHLARIHEGRRGHLLHLGALAATIVALWSHESGIIILPFVAGLELLLLWRRGERQPALWLGGHLAATIIFVAQWMTVERVPSDETVTLAGLQPKALFFLQGLSYPFSAQLYWLESWIGFAPGLLEAGLLALIFVFGAYLASAWLRTERNWHQRVRILAVPVIGVLIAAVASAPAMARLSWEYVQDAPRLLYLVGAGAALFWGLLPMLEFRVRWITVVWRVATSLLLVGVVVQSWLFIGLRMDMFAVGTSAVDGIVRAGERHAGRGLVVVNAPSWLAMNEYEYPYGHLGAQVVPSYIGLDRVIYTSSRHAVQIDAASVSLDPDVSGNRFTFGPHGSTSSREVLSQLLWEGRVVVSVQRDANGYRVQEAGRLLAGGAEQRSDSPGVIAEDVVLSPVRAAQRGGDLVLYLSWNVLGELDKPVDAVVQLRRSDDGETVSANEYEPLLGVVTPEQWQAGDRVDDTIWIGDLEPGGYSVWIGLRSEETGELLEPGLIDAGKVTVTR